ncbi:TRAP transporter substrate-binding protein [Alcaligenaceae bacterium]|nr:TRAP transporter substrate-binding protein [Alcaligenaceae bacterium]
MKRSYIFSGIVFACSVLFTMAAPVSAAASTVLKLGWTTTDSPNDPYAIGAHLFKEEVERLTNNEVTVQFYPNRQLGDERQMLEGLRFGTVDLALITNSVIAQVEPAFQVFDLPFLFSNEEQAHRVLDSDVGKSISEKLASKGVTSLGFTEGGFRQMLNNSKPVYVPADVAGVKYRVMQNPMFIDMFTALKGAAVPMAWGETFTAVQQGTIDGLEGAVAVFYASKFQEVTKYLSITNHNYSAVSLLMSSRALNRLSDEQQAKVREAGRKMVEEQRRKSAALAGDTLRLMKEAGLQINEIDDVQPFRDAMQPIYEKTRKAVGADVMDQTLAIIQE